jgi:hypothetical protein
MAEGMPPAIAETQGIVSLGKLLGQGRNYLASKHIANGIGLQPALRGP